MTNPKFSFDLGRAASTASLASGCSPEGATERPQLSTSGVIPEFEHEPISAVEEAEADMVAAGLIVEILQDELENARKYQREARDKYIALCGKAVQQ